MVNKRVSLSPKAQWLQQVKILSEALGPQSSCNFLALLYAHQHCPGRSVLWTLSQQGGCQHPALGTPRSVSQTALSKGKEYTLQTKPLCSSNFESSYFIFPLHTSLTKYYMTHMSQPRSTGLVVPACSFANLNSSFLSL